LYYFLPETIAMPATKKPNKEQRRPEKISDADLVRISREVKEDLRELAREAGESMPKYLSLLIKEARRKAFFDRLDADFERAKTSKTGGLSYEEDIAAIEASLQDGLEDE
jgi:hypothetical protein